MGLAASSFAIDSREANTTLTVPEVPEKFGYQTENAFPGLSFTRPVAVVSRPGDDSSLFVVEQSGIIYQIADPASPTKSIFLNITDRVDSSSDEEGLFSLAFDPDWQTNRQFFVLYTVDATTAAGTGRHDRLSRFEIDPADPTKALPSSEQPLISQFDQHPNHNGGEVAFGPDGYLYISLGDEGSSNDAFNNSRRIDKDFFAAIMRIDVDKGVGSLEPNSHPAVHLDGLGNAFYGIPPDNPFLGSTSFNGASVDPAGVRTEFYAVGLRNPWRFTFDAFTGTLFCADVGQSAREEVNVIVSGGDYGWEYREGLLPLNDGDGDDTPPAGVTLIDPVLDYPRSGLGASIPGGKLEGRSISGGIVYHGDRISQLDGYYLFGDYLDDRIFAFRYNESTSIVEDVQQLTSVIEPVSFGADPANGDPLIVSLDGIVYRLVYSETPIAGDPIPTSLSTTGAFTDLSSLSPEAGIEPYDINVPFWSDHAIKSRWFSVPDLADTIDFDATDNWSFPDGTVWIKHFEMEMVEGDPLSNRRLETRFLVKNSDGIHGFTYKWNTEETDAFLVEEEGEDEVLTILDSEGSVVRTQTWRYPSRSECLQCHTSVGGLALGFNTLQLNGDYDYGAGALNQIGALDSVGYFDTSPGDPSLLDELYPDDHPSATAEDKARSYLHANCVQCHQPGGPSQGNWDARYLTGLSLAGIIDGELVNDQGDPDNKVIASGDLTHSMILQRMSTRGTLQMPPLGSNETDSDGITIMSNWISSLGGGGANPVISSSRSSFTFTEGDGETVIDNSIGVSDTDTTDFSGGNLTVSLVGTDGIDDRLSIQNQGSGSGQIGVSGSTVSYEGTPIGTVSGGESFSSPLVVSITSSASPLAIEALCQAITFQNISSTPLVFDRTVEFLVTDETSLVSNTLSYTVSITTIPEDPVVSWSNPGDIVYGTALSATQLNASASVAGTSSYSPDAGTVLNAGSTQPLQVTFTPTDTQNYNVVIESVNINVGKAFLTLSATDAARSYGSADPAFTYTASGFVNGDAQGDIDTPPSLTTTATSASPAGTYPINLSGAADANYDFGYVAGSLTVDPAPLTIQADDKSRPVGESNPALTATYTGFVLGEGPSDLDTPPELSTSAVPSSPPGSYAISVFGASDPNYSITFVGGILAVGKVSATLTASDSQRPYGSANPSFTFTASGLLNGDTIEDIDTPPILNSTAVSSSSVGDYAITISGAEDDVYVFSYTNGTLSIDPAPLSIQADDLGRPYGQSNPTLTATYSGFVLGEGPADLSSPVILTTSAGPSSLPGEYAIDASGASDPNYEISFSPGTLTVGKATATLVATDANKLYGSANPGFSFTASGLLNGDTEADIDTPPTLTTAANSSSPAGVYAINISGAADPKYDFSYTAGALTVDPVSLTIQVDDKGRPYGQPNPTLTASYSGFVLGEGPPDLDVAATLSTSAGPTSPPGSYAISASGADDPNYLITTLPGTLTISKANATLAAVDAQRSFGSENPSFDFTASGLINGDTVGDIDTPPALTTTATNLSPPGNYPVNLSGAADPNYEFSYASGTLTVNPAPLTISADDKSRSIGQPNPAFTASYSGFVLDEGPDDLDTPPAITSTADASSSAGAYPITVSGASDANYSITYEDGTLSVDKAIATLTATNSQRPYGSANPTLTFTATGLLNGDTIEDIETPPSLSTTAISSSPTGNYPITLSGASDSDYDFVYNPGTLTVEPASLTITAEDHTRIYGELNPPLTATYSGFVLGEGPQDLVTPAGLSTSATSASNAGEYVISVSGASSPNYDISYNSGTLTVGKAEATLTAIDALKTYGSANPVFSFSVSGLVNGDISIDDIDTPPELSTTATPASTPGNYPINISGASDSNYTFSYNPGTLSVSPAPLTIAADDKERDFGQANPELTATYTGFVLGQGPQDLDTPPVLQTTATVESTSALYEITASGASDPNYAITFESGFLSVGRTLVTLTANGFEREYGEPNPELTYVASGLVNGDTVADIDTPPTIGTSATQNSGVGSYEINITGADDPDYFFSYKKGSLEITPALLNASGVSVTRTYGSPNPALTIDYEGFALGETVADLDTPPSILTSALTDSPVGDYGIVVTGGSDTNYTFNYNPATLTIEPAPLTIAAQNKIRSYGQANPAFTASYSGFVLGEGPQNLITPPTLQTIAVPSSAVGSYAITVTGASSNNYAIAYGEGTLEIQRAGVTLAADDVRRFYGSENPAFTFKATGLASGESINDIDSPPSLSTSATSASPSGTYDIEISGASDPNYDFSYTKGSLTVDPTPLSIEAEDKSRPYGQSNPAFTAAYSGFVLGEGPQDLETPAELEADADENSPVGSYPITVSGAASGNYAPSFTEGVLEVQKAVATLTAADAQRFYGSENPPLSFTATGLAAGETTADIDTIPTLSTLATANSAPGSYTISISGASDPNYAFAHVPGTLTIDPAVLTIKAENKRREFGEPNPALTATYSGFVLGEGPEDLDTPATLSTEANAGSPNGLYGIAVSGASDSNYEINLVDGYLSIGRALATLVAQDKQKIYGSPNPTLTFEAMDLITPHTVADIDTPPTLSTAAEIGSDAGLYPINISGAEDSEYFFVYEDAALEILPSTLTVTAEDKIKTYGQPNPPLTASYAGFVNDDDESNLDTPPQLSTEASESSSVGDYLIDISGAIDLNYNFEYSPGTLTVEPAPLTITAEDKQRAYGQANPVFSASYIGLVLGDTPESLGAQVSMNSSATTGSLPGNYPISISGSVSSNYLVEFIDGTLVINAHVGSVKLVYDRTENTSSVLFSGVPLFEYEIEASPDLAVWQTTASITTDQNGLGTFTFEIDRSQFETLFLRVLPKNN